MFHFLQSKKDKLPSTALTAITDGRLIPIEQVSDAVFAQKMLGDGVAILPQTAVITAPCAGRITMIYPTLHAFGMISQDGLEMLIHIGINTVKLKGVGFHQHVAIHDDVEANDPIISFDASYLSNHTLDFTTMLLFPDCNRQLTIKTRGHVRKGKDVVVTYQ